VPNVTNRLLFLFLFSSKQRTPSYTDRILWKEKTDQETKNMRQTTYSSHMTYISSDHRPISGEFIVDIPVCLFRIIFSTFDYPTVVTVVIGFWLSLHLFKFTFYIIDN